MIEDYISQNKDLCDVTWAHCVLNHRQLDSMFNSLFQANNTDSIESSITGPFWGNLHIYIYMCVCVHEVQLLHAENGLGNNKMTITLSYYSILTCGGHEARAISPAATQCQTGVFGFSGSSTLNALMWVLVCTRRCRNKIGILN